MERKSKNKWTKREGCRQFQGLVNLVKNLFKMIGKQNTNPPTRKKAFYAYVYHAFQAQVTSPKIAT